MTAAIAKQKTTVEDFEGEPLAAFVIDNASREVIVKAAATRNWREDIVQEGDIGFAIQCMVDMAAPRIVIVELGAPERATLDVAALSQSCGPETAIIGIGTINDVELYRELTHSGLADYLVKPVHEDALDRVLDRAIRIAQGDPEEAKKGKLITVVGARGGVGASTIALNCAWLMAQEQNLQTAILDLDVYFGTSALALDLLPGRGLREALENPGRIDSLFVASAMVGASDHLSILAGEEPLDDEFMMDPAALDELVNELRQNFTRVVVDLPRSMMLSQRHVLAISSEVVIVADLSLAAVRDTARIRALVIAAAPRTLVMVVANKVGGKNPHSLSRADFENAIETRIDHMVPDDQKAVGNALNAGKSVSQQAKGSKIVKALRELSCDVTGIQPMKRGGLLRRKRLLRR